MDVLDGSWVWRRCSAPMTASIEYVKAGTLRPLAVTSAARLEALPGVPTVDETLSGYETTFWGGIAAPKARPRKSSAS